VVDSGEVIDSTLVLLESLQRLMTSIEISAFKLFDASNCVKLEVERCITVHKVLKRVAMVSVTSQVLQEARPILQLVRVESRHTDTHFDGSMFRPASSIDSGVTVVVMTVLDAAIAIIGTLDRYHTMSPRIDSVTHLTSRAIIGRIAFLTHIDVNVITAGVIDDSTARGHSLESFEHFVPIALIITIDECRVFLQSTHTFVVIVGADATIVLERVERDCREIIGVPLSNVATGATDEFKLDTQARTLRTQAISDTICSRGQGRAPMDSTGCVDLLFDTIETVTNGESVAIEIDIVLIVVSSVLTQAITAIKPAKSVVQARAVIVAEVTLLVVILLRVSSPGLHSVSVFIASVQFITLPEVIPIARIIAMRAPEVRTVATHPRKDRRAIFTSNLHCFQQIEELSTSNHCCDVNSLRIAVAVSVRSTEC